MPAQPRWGPNPPPRARPNLQRPTVGGEPAGRRVAAGRAEAAGAEGGEASAEGPAAEGGEAESEGAEADGPELEEEAEPEAEAFAPGEAPAASRGR